MKIFRCSLADRRVSARAGFTIAEVMVAMAIFVFTALALHAIYMMGSVIGEEGAANVDLQTDAYIAMEKITRGINGRSGVREARWVDPALLPQRLDYIDATLVPRAFYSVGTNLMYDPDRNVAGNEIIIARSLGAIGGLPGFQVNQISADHYQIVLAFQRQVGQRLLTAQVTSGVTIRN